MWNIINLFMLKFYLNIEIETILKNDKIEMILMKKYLKIKFEKLKSNRFFVYINFIPCQKKLNDI